MTEAVINDGRPFSAANAADLGISRSALRVHLAENRVRRVFIGVYVDATVPDDRHLRAAALHLVKPAGSVFYGPTVAFLRGVDTFPPRDRFDFKPQCIVPHHDGRSKRVGVICHEGYLPAEDVQELEGLLVTTPLRTTVDMLRSLWRPHALAAADSMAHAGLVTQGELTNYLPRLKGYPGIVQARALAVLVDPRVESPGESCQRLRVVDAGLPLPEPQISIRNHWGREVARIDNGYRASKVGMEYDGREWHDDEKSSDEDDERRTYLRRSLGWRLIVARQADIFGKDPSFEQQVGEWIGITPRPRSW